jgi:hypothetical protein
MRGIELPINTIIIVVLAILVLAAVAGLFGGSFTPGSGTITVEGAKNNACQKLLSMGCSGVSLGSITVKDFDANKDGKLNPGTICYTDGSGFYNCVSPYGSVSATGTQDNLYTLCVKHFNCPGADPSYRTSLQYFNEGHSDPARSSMDASIQAFNQCCRVNICGCPIAMT